MIEKGKIEVISSLTLTVTKKLSEKVIDVFVPKDTIVQLPEDFEVRDVDQEDIGKSVRHSGITEEPPSMIYDDIRGQANEGDQWPSGFPGRPE